MAKNEAPDDRSSSNRAQLGQIAMDRKALVSRIRRTGWWFHTALSMLIAIGVMVFSPSSPLHMSFGLALCVFGLIGVDALRGRVHGVSLSRPSGRRPKLLVAVLAIVTALVLSAATLTLVFQQEQLLIPLAGVGFVAIFTLSWIYDKALEAEIINGY